MRPLTLVAISALVATTALAPATSAKSAAVDISTVASSPASAGWKDRPRYQPRLPGGYKNLVVLFQENHSFDNLYGGWGRVGRQRVEGLPEADRRRTVQRAQDGSRYRCLPQVDVNLTSPPLPATCTDSRHDISSAFRNRPFSIDDYIEPTDTTCPVPGAEQPNGTLNGQGLPGGCTRDLVHRFYQEKFQSNGGRQDRYVTGSDAVGLSMGHYDTTRLPIYRYLHSAGAPHYVIADRFFAGAHGGSFLNHQWLVAGRAPVVDQSGTVPDPTKRPRNSVIDSNGMPTAYPQYVPTSSVLDGELTVRCANPDRLVNYRRGCGNFAVNTVQPASFPYSSGGPFIPLIDNARYPNIGDRLSDKGISWNWYSGGWDDAESGNPGPLFQYHHQPFNYFADYAPGTPGRRHLQDEQNFFRAARTGKLPTVSFVKPYGAENEHPGYASTTSGSSHLVDLVKAVMNGPQARETLVMIVYDEFGGQWDHVSPPGPTSPTRGAYDAFGPGTRIPAMLLSKRMTRSGVDHTQYDTTSINATLERAFGLAPVGIRDTKVNDLRRAILTGSRR